MVVVFVAGYLSSRPHPKYLIAIGAGFIVLSMYRVTIIHSGTCFWHLAKARMLRGIGLPFIFLPIISASDDGIPASRIDQVLASAQCCPKYRRAGLSECHEYRISTHRELFHQSRPIEHVVPSNGACQNMFDHATSYFMGLEVRW